MYDDVIINEKAQGNTPNTLHKRGVIIERLNNAIYDYRILYDDTKAKFKEEELDLVEDGG